ncbi:hypothetical protein [Phaeovulum sp.]|uniref:hypothetical protein n=1 Tax=Phaeovulum sp. TaxID=2934796 RepID=UPI0035635273
MNFDTWKDLPTRKKAIWPAAAKGYLEPQQMVMISLDDDLAAWLVNHLVGQSSFSNDLEETLITALRVIKGDLSLDHLSELKALAQARAAIVKQR